MPGTPRIVRIMIAAAMLMAPRAVSAHFLWLTIEPSAPPRSSGTVHAFLNESAEPGGPEFLKYVRGVRPTVDGVALSTTSGRETVDANWAGKLPGAVDAELDLGVNSRGGKPHRLYYTARAQTRTVSPGDRETGGKLRVRLVTRDGKPLIQVLFEGKPAPRARIKAYPQGGEPRELSADEQGFATVDGVAGGKTCLWANLVEPKAGELNGKAYSETRFYATLTYSPASSMPPASSASGASPPSASFASMPSPAVNSFGGAVLGDWLYVYSGHVGRTHEYSVNTTSRHFRRLNLRDRKTWEELPMNRDVQGVALVTDGTYLYRVGGMSARNQPGKEHDLHSVADFARFDPGSRVWTDLAPMPTARSTHDVVIIGRKVFAVGGWTMKGASEESVYCDHAAEFDLDAPEAGWKTFRQPFRRRALSAAEAGGKLYVIAGLTDAFKVERRVDVYDPRTATWTLGPELPGTGKTDGFGTSAFGIGGRVYCSGASGKIFTLGADGRAWEAIGAWSLPRITHRLLPGPGLSILAVGGNAKGAQTPVIELVDLPPVGLVASAGR